MNDKYQITSDGTIFEVLSNGSIKKLGVIPGTVGEAGNKDNQSLSSSIIWWKAEGMQPVSMSPLQQSFLLGNPIFSWPLRIIVVILIVIPIGFKLRHNLFPNFVRKKRKELLDTDFIQDYSRRQLKYVIIARGSSKERKYGVFNVRNIKQVIPYSYDKLEWLDKDKTLLAVKDGKEMVIDVKGNEFN